MTKPERILVFLLLLSFTSGSAAGITATAAARLERTTQARTSLSAKPRHALHSNRAAAASSSSVLPVEPTTTPSATASTRLSAAMFPGSSRSTIGLVPNDVPGLETTPPRGSRATCVATATDLTPGTLIRFKRITDHEALFARPSSPQPFGTQGVTASPSLASMPVSSDTLGFVPDIGSTSGFSPFAGTASTSDGPSPLPSASDATGISQPEKLPVILLPGGPEFRLFPGSVCRVGKGDLTLLLGRVRVNVGENASPTAILGRSCRFELSQGEAMAQVDIDSNATFALSQGDAWVRGNDRAEEVLTAGKGITVTRDGKLGKVGEMDPRLQEEDTLPTFGPTAWLRPPAPSAFSGSLASDAAVASDSAAILASGTPDPVATDSEPLLPHAAADPATKSPQASGSEIIVSPAIGTSTPPLFASGTSRDPLPASFSPPPLDQGQSAVASSADHPIASSSH